MSVSSRRRPFQNGSVEVAMQLVGPLSFPVGAAGRV
jgi:hypothetical protein